MIVSYRWLADPGDEYHPDLPARLIGETLKAPVGLHSVDGTVAAARLIAPDAIEVDIELPDERFVRAALS